MSLHITTLTIEGFRAIDKLTLGGLGRVNLITGRNNSGKSSVLEALRILSTDASPSVIFSILRYREEDLGELEDAARLSDIDSLFQMTSLFAGFPQLSDKPTPIKISSHGDDRALRISLRVGWVSEERSSEGIKRVIQPQLDIFGQEEGFPALIVETVGGERLLRLDYARRYPSRLYRAELSEEFRLPCVYVSAYGGEKTATLGSLWDKIALSDHEKDVVDAMQIIDAKISAVSMVGGEGPRQVRTAIVRSNDFQRPVPLRSFGDGLNRLFGIILSLVNAKDGILLIDEYENGIHHTVQLDMWKVIFGLARKLNVQVFATSHSWDAIEAFQKAAAETPEDGVLIRLTRSGRDLVSTQFHEQELEIATRDGIEVR